MLRLAIGAGHGLYTAGKRTLKLLDSNETREWVLNDRIVSRLIERLKEYKDVEVLRVDDHTGKIDVSLVERVRLVNEFQADLYLSVHHDAGIKGGKGGGITTYTAVGASKTSNEYQHLVYKKLIEHTGLKGNRATPINYFNFYELRYTTVPAVLVEHGFMDSVIDVPIILSETFVNQCANGHIEALEQYFELKKKSTTTKTMHRVQVGAYSVKSNAEKMLDDLKLAGFNGFIKEEDAEIVVPEKPEIIIPNKKSLYIEKGNAQIIKTRPDNIEIKVLGDTLHGAGAWGVNGVLYDTNTAPVEDPESCVFIAMNEGKALSNNAQFNGWNGPPRATLIYHNNNKMGFRQLQNINPIRDITNWAVGGYMVKPYMDFANEKIPGSVNYQTAHTYIGVDADENIYLIVRPNHMIRDIVPLLDELDIIGAVVLDGGGSSQLNHPDGHFRSTRRINTAILLKEV